MLKITMILAKKITKGMKNKYHEFTDSFSDFIERVDDITWRIRDSFDYIGGLKIKKLAKMRTNISNN